MNVTALYIYPYKGGPAVEVDEWLTTARGFQHDRRFMVTNTAGQFLAQRSHPALGRPAARFEADGFAISTPELGELRFAPQAGDLVPVQVWSHRVEAVRVSDAADEWFSELLGEPAQLVYMPDAGHRPTDDHADNPLSFADAYPYLIANTASLDDLNARIAGAAVPMKAFRPNIVLTGATPWAEDEWGQVEMGEAVFDFGSNCERCSVTTFDPMYPDRPRPDGEPLRTLAKFRRNARGKVDFARYALTKKPGRKVRVGDAVTLVG